MVTDIKPKVIGGEISLPRVVHQVLVIVVVSIVNPRTTFTFNSSGWSLDGLVCVTPTRVTRHKNFREVY